MMGTISFLRILCSARYVYMKTITSSGFIHWHISAPLLNAFFCVPCKGDICFLLQPCSRGQPSTAALQFKRGTCGPPSIGADMMGWNWIATEVLGCEGHGTCQLEYSEICALLYIITYILIPPHSTPGLALRSVLR